jgi:uncharacterized protein (DUF1800 family)
VAHRAEFCGWLTVTGLDCILQRFDFRRRGLAIGMAAALGALAAAANAGQGDAPGSLREERAQQRLMDGHLLRRLGFGPNRREMHEVMRIGRAAYTELQLHPERIDDRVGVRRFRREPGRRGDSVDWLLRWLTRMTFSRRQLQEKMALIWHEHFANSVATVKYFDLMRDQETLFRERGLGGFRELLIAITTDNAMLRYLNNSGNDGQLVDEHGNRVAPNENYARELLQLFSLGVHKLNMDGTLVLDEQANPVPAYSETDVREIARALTGWTAAFPTTFGEDPTAIIPAAVFDPSMHDAEQKTVLGEGIAADYDNPAGDVERVVDIIMRQPTTAPFVAKQLILRLATETPSPSYVRRVASVFTFTGGSIRATVRAILTDAEFYSPAVMRSQYKTPVEHFVGALRGLGTTGSLGTTLFYLTGVAGQLPYYPPSVFSFYRPGEKDSLVTAAYVAARDQGTDLIANQLPDSLADVSWDAAAMMRRHRLSARRPTTAVDLLARDLLAAPLSQGTRDAVLDYIGPRVTEEKLRGAAWLIMCSPDYQVN